MIVRTLWMSRLAPSVLLLACIFISACASDDEGDDGDGDGGEPETFTCFASLSPVTFDYVVSGDLLEVSGNGNTDTWERVGDGDGARPVHGIWLVDEETTSGVGEVRLDFVVEADQVSALADCDFGSVSATAEAVSPAEITDTTITILESDEDVQIVTR